MAIKESPSASIAAEESQIAKAVLMPGDPLRAKYVADHYLEEVVCFNTVRNMLGYTGTYKGKRISVMGHGMGVPSMGIYSYELYQFFGVDTIIRIGSAGGIGDDVKVRDVVIALGASTNSHFADQYRFPGQLCATADFGLLRSAVETAEAMPMLAERTLIVVTDWDIYKLNEDQRERFIALLEDLPEYCCIVFVYDTVAYKQNKTVKKLCKAMDAHVTPIEFKAQDTSDLTAWIARRFKALGKQIDRQTAEYLIFLCGGLMTGLSQEIAKIGAYAKGEVITQRDIDAVADPVLSAEIFKMTDAVSQSDYNKAAAILGDLLKMQEEPIVILAALGSQLRRLYTARMAIDSGKDKYWLMELWEMRSDYPAKLLLQSAKRVSAQWCGDAVKMCQVADLRMKSQRGVDPAEELKLLLARLGAARK